MIYSAGFSGGKKEGKDSSVVTSFINNTDSSMNHIFQKWFHGSEKVYNNKTSGGREQRASVFQSGRKEEGEYRGNYNHLAVLEQKLYCYHSFLLDLVFTVLCVEEDSSVGLKPGATDWLSTLGRYGMEIRYQESLWPLRNVGMLTWIP